VTEVAVATHSRVRRVLVGDDDGSGLIYFPSYYHYMSEGDQELFELLGMPVTEQFRQGIASPVAHSRCDYVAPARAGDLLRHDIALFRGAHSSMTVRHTFAREDGTLVARGEVVRVWVELATMTVRPIPAWIPMAAPASAAAMVRASPAAP
jgi:YbgC/YbaW family acyl-CoA thioester hydrolase